MVKRVRKSSGSLEDFDPRKVYEACVSAGAPPEIAHEIAKEVEQKVYDGMTTDEIRRYVLVRLKELAPHAYESWTFYDRVVKGRITFEDGKVVVVEKGRVYLGREVKDVGPTGLSSAEEVESILKELGEDLTFGVSKATVNARLYALFMGVLKSSKMPKQEKEKSVQLINEFRVKLGWKPYELKKQLE
ncbi:MAG: ATP cone domain-containing protein [Thermofilaceae archaeon]|nr:ATP cone domain-containing protein [Thermofilaceae archaeon]MCX8180106.1 ATP cone domain-containing protein [Thermofilaceae archaeon]MDW8004239.1 ATP cone domain-containing protein [Thermofilaceae archaeon]